MQADPLHGLDAATVEGKPVLVEYEPDPDLRDSEQVPLLEPGGIEAFIRREVLPYKPDAWVKADATKIGYEISFTRHFYKPQPLRTLEEDRRRHPGHRAGGGGAAQRYYWRCGQMSMPQFDVTPFLRQDEGQHFDRKSLWEGREGAKRARDRRAVRDQGEGIPRMFAEMADAFLPQPKIETSQRGVSVTLRNTPTLTSADRELLPGWAAPKSATKSSAARPHAHRQRRVDNADMRELPDARIQRVVAALNPPQPAGTAPARCQQFLHPAAHSADRSAIEASPPRIEGSHAGSREAHARSRGMPRRMYRPPSRGWCAPVEHRSAGP